MLDTWEIHMSLYGNNSLTIFGLIGVIESATTHFS